MTIKLLHLRTSATRVRRSNSHQFEGDDKFTGAVTFAVVGKFGNERVRLALGTESQSIAVARLGKIKEACVAGSDSPLWSELKVLPKRTYAFFFKRAQSERVVLATLSEPKLTPQVRFVYLIRATESHRVKIGVAEDVDERLQTLQIGSPEILKIEAFVPFSKAPECWLHNKFLSSREHGEWFRSTPELEAFISELKSAKIAEAGHPVLDATVRQPKNVCNL
jgi:T5orf172 domain